MPSPCVYVPGGETGDLVNVPVEEGVRLRVGDVEQLAGLGHVPGDPLVHGHADLVEAALEVKVEVKVEIAEM